LLSFTSFRRTDRLGVLQYSIFSPVDYRFLDAIYLKYYMDYENEQDADSSDYFDDGSASFDDDYCFSSQPITSSFRRH
jgi:hypothetical protein